MNIDDYNNEIASRIVAARKLRGLTQKEVAEQTNYSTKNISKIEKGYTNITLSHLQKFSPVLQENILYFLPPTYIDPELNNLEVLFRNIKSLGSKYRRIISVLTEELLSIQNEDIKNLRRELDKLENKEDSNINNELK